MGDRYQVLGYSMVRIGQKIHLDVRVSTAMAGEKTLMISLTLEQARDLVHDLTDPDADRLGPRG